jgi:polysaccharide export outer membrane protein
LINRAIVIMLIVLCSACTTYSPRTLPRGQAAYEVIPAVAPSVREEYLIAPLDTLRVNVLYEPELSQDRIQVAADGTIAIPLLGDLEAAGKSIRVLQSEMTAGLRRYVKEPRVTVTVVETVGRRIVVEGEVNDPGVYDIAATASLLEALARANGPTRTARLNEIVVFRTLRGQRLGAVFDLRRIRVGADSDPRLLPGDIIVVGYSNVRGLYRDFLTAAPVIAAFRPY